MLTLRTSRLIASRGKVALLRLLLGLLLPVPALAGPPPVITIQPLSQVVLPGSNVEFLVLATSGTTLSYQWCKNGTNIPGADQSTYSITNVQSTHQGVYSVKLTNAGGMVTSSNAVLTVLGTPVISNQPQGQSVVVGQSATFSVSAIGMFPLSYQWSLNGSPLVGATNDTLNLDVVRPANAGTYTVLVTNSAGAAPSSGALLTVSNPPSSLTVASSVASTGTVFSFKVSVPAGATYIILASSDAVTWRPIATNVAMNSTEIFTDPESSMHRQRFYRALVP